MKSIMGPAACSLAPSEPRSVLDWPMVPVSSWALPSFPEMKDAEIHVWRAALDVPGARVQSLLSTLTPDERARAEQFQFPRERGRFIVARGFLRTILARYLGFAPGQLRFSFGPRGKPALARRHGGETIHFNVSHSHGLALLAVAREREVGVDIERVRTDVNWKQIAGWFFSAEERAQLRAAPAGLGRQAFFWCWVRKEARVKATGEGFSTSLTQLDVSRSPREEPRWLLYDLIPASGYVAALAVTRPNRGVRVRLCNHDLMDDLKEADHA